MSVDAAAHGVHFQAGLVAASCSWIPRPIYSTFCWRAFVITLLCFAPLAKPESALTSFFNTSSNQQELFYIGADHSIYEAYWSQGFAWQGGNVTAAANIPPAAFGSPLTSFFDPSSNQQHVLYISANQHIYQAFWDPNVGWQGQDVSASTNLPEAAFGSSLMSFFNPSSNQQQVFYIGPDQNLYELYWTPGVFWQGENVTAAAKVPSAALGSSLTGFFNSSSNQQEAFYIGADQNIYEVYWTLNIGWQGGNVTAAANVAPPVIGSPLSSFFNPSGTQQQVFYIGPDQHVHQVYWTPNLGWQSQDVSVAANDPTVADTSSITSFFNASGTNQQQVFFIGNDQVVYQDYWTPGVGWTAEGVSVAAGDPLAAAGSSLTSFFNPSSNQQQVFYIGADQNVYQAYWTPGVGWSGQDVSAAAKDPTADKGSSLAPSSPVLEYIYLRGKAVAIENPYE